MAHSTEQQMSSRAAVGLRSERGPILLSVMLSVGLIAIDATILATAVPSIVNDLGGFAHFPWLFSIYLLAQAVSVPIFAKFTDLMGRKPIMLVGIGLFVLGSILCGIAWSMPALIAFRALQGLGAGAVQPTAMTIIGDIYSVAERARVQGYVASVWAMSAVVGPTLGGLFVDFLDWRWIFFVNIPLGALAAWWLFRRFDENVVRKQHRIDVGGAVLLGVGASLIILGLLEGGILWPWTSVQSIAILAIGASLLIGFAFVERRAAEPILPGWVFRSRLLNSTNLAALGAGVMLIVLTSFIPLYAQGVLRTSALVAGFASGSPHTRLATCGLHGRPDLSENRLPQDRADRCSGSHDRFRAAGLAVLQQLGLAGRRDLLCDGSGHGTCREPDADLRAVVGRVGTPWRCHRHQHVRPVNGQRAGHRGLRRDCQRVAQPTGGRAHLLHRQRDPGQHPRARAAQGLSGRCSWSRSCWRSRCCSCRAACRSIGARRRRSIDACCERRVSRAAVVRRSERTRSSVRERRRTRRLPGAKPQRAKASRRDAANRAPDDRRSDERTRSRAQRAESNTVVREE